MRPLLSLLLLVGLAAPAALRAQEPLPAPSRVTDHQVFYLGLNALLHGLHAAIRTDDGNRLEAFAEGALGGTVTYAGQRMVASQRQELRFAGLQVANLGANIARNAGDDIPVLSRLVVPLPGSYLYFEQGRPLRFRLSAAAFAGVGYMLTGDYDARFDLEETLVSGTLVFRSEHGVFYRNASGIAARCLESIASGCPHGMNGLSYLNVVLLNNGTYTERTESYVEAHEFIHITQFNRDAILFALPFHDAYLSESLGEFSDYVTTDLFLPLVMTGKATGYLGVSPGLDNWNEREAGVLMGDPGRCQRVARQPCFW